MSNNKENINESDPPKIDDFKGLLGWVVKKKEESKVSGEPWGWVMALIAAAIVFFSLAYTAFVAWRKGREIAILKHKIDVNEELKIQKFTDAEIADEKEKQIRLQQDYRDLCEDIGVAKYEILKLEKERLALNKKIDGITNWSDLDNF